MFTHSSRGHALSHTLLMLFPLSHRSQPGKFARAGLFQSMSAMTAEAWKDLTKARGADVRAVDIATGRRTCAGPGNGQNCEVFRIIEVMSSSKSTRTWTSLHK